MKVGSLFSGIGGFDLGLERAGFQTVWFCEQNEFCQRVLDKHWPGVPCYPDITELRGSDVEPVDVLCGGFPCQDLSYWVEITIKPGSDAIERVTGPNGDEWRAHMYVDIEDREDVLQHFAWNAVHNGITDARHLDGWADLEPGEVTMKVGR